MVYLHSINRGTNSFSDWIPDNEASRRVVDGEMAPTGYGQAKFISHNQLDYDAAHLTQYLKNDCLYFQIEVKAAKPTKPWLTCTV